MGRDRVRPSKKEGTVARHIRMAFDGYSGGGVVSMMPIKHPSTACFRQIALSLSLVNPVAKARLCGHGLVAKWQTRQI